MLRAALRPASFCQKQVFLELFAGEAGVSKAMQGFGFVVGSVDSVAYP